MPKKQPGDQVEREAPEGAAAAEAAAEAAPETPPEESPQAIELAVLKDQYLRLMAEYDNYRKRSQKEREALYADIRAETVKKLLPVMDNLERAVAAPCTDAAYAQGVEMTFKQCGEALGSMDVSVIEAAGQPFDPELHDAVMHVEDESAGENTVVQVLQQGYRMGERVLRHAMVKVAN